MCLLTTEEVNSTSEVSVNVTVGVANQFYPLAHYVCLLTAKEAPAAGAGFIDFINLLV